MAEAQPFAYAKGDVCWIWCDLDGRGKRWRLAIKREMECEDEPGVLFPLDEDHHDYAENYYDDPAVDIDYPKGGPE